MNGTTHPVPAHAASALPKPLQTTASAQSAPVLPKQPLPTERSASALRPYCPAAAHRFRKSFSAEGTSQERKAKSSFLKTRDLRHPPLMPLGPRKLCAHVIAHHLGRQF